MDFKEIYTANIKREGSAELLTWLEQSDFFAAPASSRFHSACNGGLESHSVAVYERLKQQAEILHTNYSDETLAVVALLHDICKVNMYKQDFRNVKNAQGVWEKVPCYTVDEKFNFGGHGSKSVYLAMLFMKLTPDEATAINCHMSAFDRSPNDYSIGNAFEHNQLALMLSVADQYATWIDNK